MQKTIRIMAIIALILAAFSLFLLLITIPFQAMIARGLYGSAPEMLGILPRFPLISFLNCALCGGCMALLLICCGKKGGGIWLEILVLACLVVLPLIINNIAAPVYTVFVGQMRGSLWLSAETVVTRIGSVCLIPFGWGQALAYVTCGMSIAFKKMSKNADPAGMQEENVL